MTVYVESNFVLELALHQEQATAARAILDRASRSEFLLAVPSLSLAEPFTTITQRRRGMRKLGGLIGDQSRDLSRSTLHREAVRDLAIVQSHLAGIAEQEVENLAGIVAEILSVCQIIPPDLASFTEARQLQRELDLAPEDSMVLAAVLKDLRQPGIGRRNYFVNRNVDDFGVPEVISLLRRHHCEFLGSFNDADLALSSF